MAGRKCNPLAVNKLLNPEGLLPATPGLIVRAVTQEEYDIMSPRCPHTIFIITNSTDGRMYIGDVLILNMGPKRTYLIGPAEHPGEYQIWLNTRAQWTDQLAPISRFDCPQKAINAMNRYNQVGFHFDWAIAIFNILLNYIRRDLGIHDTMMGIIAAFGWKNHVKFQDLIKIAVNHNAHNSRIDIPVSLREDLLFLRGQVGPPKGYFYQQLPENELIEFYAALYDLFVEWDFFKHKRYQNVDPETLDLSEYVTRIGKVFVKDFDLNIYNTISGSH